MKIIKLIIVAFVAVLSFSACQKEFTPDVEPPPSLKVRTYTEDLTYPTLEKQVTTYDLNYDASDRVISLISEKSPGNKFVYDYTSNGYTLDVFNANLLSIHAVYFLNSASLVDSSLQFNGYDTTTEKYTYNSEKQLLTKNVYDYSTATGALLTSSHSYAYDNNGNVISDTYGNSVITFTFYPNLTNNISIGQVFFIQNRNLIKTTTYNLSGVTFTTNHTYTFDNKKRITSERVEASNGEILVKSYTYF